MLYHLATTNEDSLFREFYNAIQRTFYDEEKYQGQIDDLPQWRTQELPGDEEKIRQVNTAIDSIVSRVCSETGLYISWDSNGSRAEAKLFPFLDRYHRYFVKNKRWNTPLRAP